MSSNITGKEPKRFYTFVIQLFKIIILFDYIFNLILSGLRKTKGSGFRPKNTWINKENPLKILRYNPSEKLEVFKRLYFFIEINMFLFVTAGRSKLGSQKIFFKTLSFVLKLKFNINFLKCSAKFVNKYLNLLLIKF